jgi:hypothetical protein
MADGAVEGMTKRLATAVDGAQRTNAATGVTDGAQAAGFVAASRVYRQNL